MEDQDPWRKGPAIQDSIETWILDEAPIRVELVKDWGQPRKQIPDWYLESMGLGFHRYKLYSKDVDKPSLTENAAKDDALLKIYIKAVEVHEHMMDILPRKYRKDLPKNTIKSEERVNIVKLYTCAPKKKECPSEENTREMEFQF